MSNKDNIYFFQVWQAGGWINPLKGYFLSIRKCWEFIIRNKRKYKSFKKRIEIVPVQKTNLLVPTSKVYIKNCDIDFYKKRMEEHDQIENE